MVSTRPCVCITTAQQHCVAEKELAPITCDVEVDADALTSVSHVVGANSSSVLLCSHRARMAGVLAAVI